MVDGSKAGEQVIYKRFSLTPLVSSRLHKCDQCAEWWCYFGGRVNYCWLDAFLCLNGRKTLLLKNAIVLKMSFLGYVFDFI